MAKIFNQYPGQVLQTARKPVWLDPMTEGKGGNRWDQRSMQALVNHGKKLGFFLR